MIDKGEGFQIPEDYDALRRLYEQIHTENLHLLKLLADNGIPYKRGADQQQAVPVEAPQERSAENSIMDARSISPVITKRSSPGERIKLYLSLFRGRSDVYACQWHSKEGKTGYSPACRNEWVRDKCGKPKIINSFMQ